MLDIKFIRENKELIKNIVLLKGEKSDIDRLLELDSQRRHFIYDVENLKKERNENSKKVADLKREKKDADKLIERTKQISFEIKKHDEQLSELSIDIKYEMDRIPNIPHSSTPEGNDSDDNVEVKTWGEIPEFDFKILDHLALGERLDILDFKRGGKITGSGFPVYKGMGARLERALINFMLDLHIREHGYTEVFPPFFCEQI